MLNEKVYSCQNFILQLNQKLRSQFWWSCLTTLLLRLKDSIVHMDCQTTSALPIIKFINQSSKLRSLKIKGLRPAEAWNWNEHTICYSLKYLNFTDFPSQMKENLCGIFTKFPNLQILLVNDVWPPFFREMADHEYFEIRNKDINLSSIKEFRNCYLPPIRYLLKLKTLEFVCLSERRIQRLSSVLPFLNELETLKIRICDHAMIQEELINESMETLFSAIAEVKTLRSLIILEYCSDMINLLDPDELTRGIILSRLKRLPSTITDVKLGRMRDPIQSRW